MNATHRLLFIFKPSTVANAQVPIVDPCSATVGQLGLACEAFWIGLSTNIQTALYNPSVASWICNHQCLQASINVAVDFIALGNLEG